MEEDEFGEPPFSKYPPFWKREKERVQIALARMMEVRQFVPGRGGLYNVTCS